MGYKLTNNRDDNAVKKPNKRYKKKYDNKNNASEKQDRKEMQIMLVFYIITAIYGLVCLFLYYKQSIQLTTSDSILYESDLPYHISMIVDDKWFYSLTAFFYLALYKLAGDRTILIALLLALVSGVTIIVSERLLRVFGIRNRVMTCVGAITLNLVMPFYIKWAGMYRYVSYQSGNVWHNSTYLCMKLAALICMLLFLKQDQNISKRNITVKEWIGVAVLLAVCTGIKPSFLTVFAPAFAIKLLYNWLHDKIPFKRIFLWGITVIPSCGVILWQNAVLFGGENKNGFKISFMETFSLHADHPKITVLLSLAFPIVVFICYITELIRTKKVIRILDDRKYLFAVVMALIGFAEAILLVETGSRSTDGNFLWGYSFALFWLYTVSFDRWNKFALKKRWIPYVICALVFIYQLICGVIFFYNLVGGASYFMYQ